MKELIRNLEEAKGDWIKKWSKVDKDKRKTVNRNAHEIGRELDDLLYFIYQSVAYGDPKEARAFLPPKAYDDIARARDHLEILWGQLSRG